MKRRMAAILIADVVGYSGLMEADEDGTAQRLTNCRSLIDAEIAKHDGRLFKAMGDAVLVEFASPINAVRCAVDIRAGLVLAEHGDERPLRMRFGLHLADVLVENDDLIGDGVNLAARIQQSADPDAIDVSAALFEQIRRNSPFAFDDRGEQSFRNIIEPVRIYRLRGEITRHIYQIAPNSANADAGEAAPFAGRHADRGCLWQRGSEVLVGGHHRGTDFRARSFQEAVRYVPFCDAGPRRHSL